MGDFHQEGTITTLHALYETFDRDEYLVNLERRLEAYSSHRRIGLLLPCLFSEIENPAVLDWISEQIAGVRYLHSIVVALGGTRKEGEFRRAEEYFQRLRAKGRDVRVLWVLGPRVQQIFEQIKQRQIPTGVPGKGQSVWIALGYLFAREEYDVIALHDCDVVTYDRLLLGRLIEPTTNPNNEFEFCKGFYPRISPAERTMKGRVTRLFVGPFLFTMAEIMYERSMHRLVDFFRYHTNFKYPLAGEFSFTTRLGQGINIAYDWSLEVSTLSEVYNRLAPRKIAQIDLTSNYEHKHQQLSLQDAKRGLHRMVVDIATFYFNYLLSHGVALNSDFIEMVRESYYQNALRFIKSYSDDAEVNGLVFDRYEEELTAFHFRDFLKEAWEQRTLGPRIALIPSWNRVVFSVPDIYEQLYKAVEADNS